MADGRPFNPKGSDYDYRTARMSGLRPEKVEDDDVPHWPSRVPDTGLLLKGRNHPTFDKGVEVDRREGYGLEMQDGRYYTKPFKKYGQGGRVKAGTDTCCSQFPHTSKAR
jgi:hypothetical protein